MIIIFCIWNLEFSEISVQIIQQSIMKIEPSLLSFIMNLSFVDEKSEELFDAMPK